MSLVDTLGDVVEVVQEGGNLTTNASSLLNQTGSDSAFSRIFGIGALNFPWMVFLWTIILGFVVVTLASILPRLLGWALSWVLTLAVRGKG